MSANGKSIILPQIDLRKCDGCGVCERLCPTGAVALVAGHAVIVRPHDCSYCEICESYCPRGAIGRPFVVVFAAGADRPAQSGS